MLFEHNLICVSMHGVSIKNTKLVSFISPRRLIRFAQKFQ